MKRIALAILFSLIALTGKAQLKFSAQADTNRILIGEQITLALSGEVAKGSDFSWPILPDTISGIEVVKYGPVDTTVSGDLWKIHQQIRITSFDSGYSALPPLSFSANGNTAISPAIGIEVSLPEISEEKELYDIKAPLEPPVDWLSTVLWIGGILLVTGLVVAIIYWITKRKKEEKLTPEQRLSPYEYAQLQLQELEGEKLWQSGNIKEYYSRLTDILRLYLERQMNINAMESTADEVITKVHTLGLSNDLNEKITSLMHTSALVKYAKETPAETTHERSLATVKEFLKATKPVEKEKEDAELPV